MTITIIYTVLDNDMDECIATRLVDRWFRVAIREAFQEEVSKTLALAKDRPKKLRP